MILVIGQDAAGVFGHYPVEAKTWEEFLCNAHSEQIPEAVVVAFRDDHRFSGDMARLFHDERLMGVPLAVYMPEPDDYAHLVCTCLGVPLVSGSIPTLLDAVLQLTAVPAHNTLVTTEILHPVFRNLLYEAIAGAFQKIGDLQATLRHLRRALAFVCEADIVMFTLRREAWAELFVCLEPSISERNYEYFLKFCKLDILLQDQYLNLDDVHVEYLFGDPHSSGRRKSDVQPLSSYASFPLCDQQGNSIGLLHLGNLRNHYFNTTISRRLQTLAAFMGPLLASTVMRREMIARQESLRALFHKFLPEPVIKNLLDTTGVGSGITGQREVVAVLFSDIRSFTTLSENNRAEVVVGFLNRHFQAMVSGIKRHGGVVDKFIGDAIVAVFRGEKGGEDCCQNAAMAALDMIDAHSIVSVDDVHLHGGRYAIGIGLHVGEVISGYIGSKEKTAYTVIGKPIDQAEELESATKRFQVPILASTAFNQRLAINGVVSHLVGNLDSGDEPQAVYALERAEIKGQP